MTIEGEEAEFDGLVDRDLGRIIVLHGGGVADSRNAKSPSAHVGSRHRAERRKRLSVSKIAGTT
jgi:hypothetical protein